MDDVWRSIEFGIGRNNQETVDHELFDSEVWRFGVAADFKDKARSQLGTVGSGNHYVDIFVDEKNRTWIGVHFGSRGLGHTLASHFIKLGGGSDGMHVKPVVFDANSNLGADYIECMNLAGEYAYAGRDWVCQRVAQILGAPIVEEIHNHHNFAWKEKHGGKDYWVVRKGATPAFPGQKGFVGGSMGDHSVILEGVESDNSREAFYSTVHGAGRIMSRTKATGRSKWGKQRGEPGVKQEDMDAWVKKVGVELRGAGVDESPQVYKRLPEVLEHHRGTVKILHTLTPIGVAMAGSDTVDPYRD
jgi:tRNA-splicing ligase RtcB